MQRVTRERIERAARVVGLDCPLDLELASAAAPKFENWSMPDTTGRPVEAVREVRDLIRGRVERLITEMRVQTP